MTQFHVVMDIEIKQYPAVVVCACTTYVKFAIYPKNCHLVVSKDKYDKYDKYVGQVTLFNASRYQPIPLLKEIIFEYFLW